MLKLFRFQKKYFFSRSGFTLIEILIGSSIFVIVMTMAINIFLFSTRLQGLVSSYFYVSDNISQTLEIISRDIRMAQPGSSTSTMFFQSSPSSLAFTDFRGKNIIYRLNNNFIERSEDGGLSYVPLTSSNVKVESISFEVSGNTLGDNLQPLVKIFLKFSSGSESNKVENYIQTAVSPRNLDI